MAALKLFAISRKPSDLGICIYGPTGVGKTSLLGTMPGKGIIIDVPQVEGGTFVLSHLTDKIQGVTCEEWEDIDDIYWALAKKDEEALPGVSELKWIAIDSITGMKEMAKRKVIRERDRNLGEDPHFITMREWGGIGELVGELIYRFRKLPYAIIFIAQERTHGGGENDPGPVTIGPDITASSLRALKPSLTIIGQMGLTIGSKGREYRTLRVGPPGGDWIVKSRTPRDKPLPYIIRDPDLSQILRYLFGKGEKPRAAKDPDALIL